MLAAEEAKASGALWLDGFASWRNVQEQQQEGPRHGAGRHRDRWNLAPRRGSGAAGRPPGGAPETPLHGLGGGAVMCGMIINALTVVR